MQLAHFGQPKMKLLIPTNGVPARSKREDPYLERVLVERNKEGDGYARTCGNETRKERSLVALTGCSEMALNL